MDAVSKPLSHFSCTTSKTGGRTRNSSIHQPCRSTPDIHTSLGCLKCLAGALWPLSFAVHHPDEEVVEAVRLEARQAALATVPTERQNLLLLIRLLLGRMQAALATIVDLEQPQLCSV